MSKETKDTEEVKVKEVAETKKAKAKDKAEAKAKLKAEVRAELEAEAKAKKTEEKSKPKAKQEKRLTLPRYLRLAKGGMWKDEPGEYSSDAIVYSLERIMVGRSVVPDPETRKPVYDDIDEPILDKFKNDNLLEYGWVDEKMPWYIDLSEIPREKLGRIIIAYKAGVLVRADPKNPPRLKELKYKSDWRLKKDGELVFNGSNQAMFKKLQNLNFQRLKEFIASTPKTEAARDNLLDLLDYEKRGFNALSRPRLEVLDMIRGKLQEYGNGMSGLRRNDIINKAKADAEN